MFGLSFMQTISFTDSSVFLHSWFLSISIVTSLPATPHNVSAVLNIYPFCKICGKLCMVLLANICFTPKALTLFKEDSLGCFSNLISCHVYVCTSTFFYCKSDHYVEQRLFSKYPISKTLHCACAKASSTLTFP